MKIVPDAASGKLLDNPEGYEIEIAQEESAEVNFRILCCASATTLATTKKKWFIPAEEKLPLLFFRRIFTELRSQQRDQGFAPPTPEGSEAESEQPRYDGEEGDDMVPIEAFQRAFERLFFILGDEDGFDAQSYDENGNCLVGWTEFATVFRRRAFSIKRSLPERIYLTFENPDSSHSAQILSYFVLLVIVLSSLAFILSTSPEYQKEPVGVEKPKPQDIFDLIENLCLGVFFIEYMVRLCTCWAVRNEVHRHNLMALSLGHHPLVLSTPASRFVTFVFGLSNMIDLIAILPGVIGWIMKIVAPGASALEGGGFVVLRLVRLTRIFRAFKNPKLQEPVIVIARTMSNSTKALYLLGFNGLLGILISGSLMYLVERGEWDPETRKYYRYVGKEWNATAGVWHNITGESPFNSIPHSFWWAVVTSTTVGYGDVFPTTTWGYVVATMTMVFSLVIAALPVGVIGGNFSQVWDDYAVEKRRQVAQTDKDRKFITSAIQRIDPREMSRLMYIEVWNERFPEERNIAGRSVSARPDVAEFLGQVHLYLQLDPDHPVAVTKHDMHLLDGAEGPLPGRKVTGTVSIQYEWTPLVTTFAGGGEPAPLQPLDPPGSAPKFQQSASEVDSLKPVQGKLKISILGCHNLMNLTYGRGKQAGSNPYCRVYVFPQAPESESPVRPSAWRSPLAVGTLAPKWHSSHTFNYLWTAPKGSAELADEEAEASTSVEDKAGRSDGTFAGSNLTKKGQIAALMKALRLDFKVLPEELHALSNRITRLSSTPEPPAERMN
jgi:hypothetical protein